MGQGYLPEIFSSAQLLKSGNDSSKYLNPGLFVNNVLMDMLT